MASTYDIEALIRRSPVSIEIPIAWGEMDALGHVNNVVYFRYLESARVAYLRRLGWLDREPSTRSGFILQSVQARFRRPLAYPDVVRVTSRLASIESDRFTLEHEVISRDLADVAAIGKGTVVAYNYAIGSKIPIERELRSAIERLESSVRA